MKQIILASSSPRRREILSLTGLPFDIIPSSYEEDNSLDMSIDKLVKHLSLGKAQDIAKDHPAATIIGCDTLVSLDGKAIGKPNDIEEAKARLRLFSGRSHSIWSGFTIIDGGTIISESSEAKIFFRTMTEQEIDWYAHTNEWQGKAGGYAIQAKGGMFIKKIEGDYYTIVGLPLCRVVERLKERGVNVA